MKKPLPIKKPRGGDYCILIALSLLIVAGITFIYSASSYVAEKDYSDRFYFVKKQLIGYLLGGAAFVFFAFFNYKKLKKISLAALIVSLVLLALVLTPLGKEVYGAKRWLGVGGFTIQPSEITKACYIVFCAAYFSNRGGVSGFKSALPVLFFGGIICLLIILEPNMSVTVCVGLLMLSMLFFAGLPVKYFVGIIVPLALAVPLLIVIEPYRLKRLYAFIDPWSSPKGEGYQLIQSLYAFGSGGLFGCGLFKSRQKLKFLPFSESDFILSVISEECGFFGVIALFLLFCFLIWRIIKTALKQEDFFGYFLCLGIAATFIIQIAVNALVVTGSIPPTGLPLPLISSGNTQIITFMSELGIVFNVSKNGKEK